MVVESGRLGGTSRGETAEDLGMGKGGQPDPGVYCEIDWLPEKNRQKIEKIDFTRGSYLNDLVSGNMGLCVFLNSQEDSSVADALSEWQLFLNLPQNDKLFLPLPQNDKLILPLT